VVAGCKKARLLPKGAKLASVWSRSLERGYPTPFLERDDLLEHLQPQLERLGILSRGRFGGWKYEVSNQDHSFMQGVEAVERLLDGAPEVTYPFPQRVNR
jgi:hypothetical protein